MAKDKTWMVVHEEPLAGYSLINIAKVLWQNKFRIHIKYIPRFLYAIILSTITVPLRLVQKLRFHSKIQKTDIKEDPIFIIGHYRTGTTYMMTLMAHDKSKGYVSNIEGYTPLFYLAFPKFTRWLIESSLPDIRPMDNVVMGADEPTEDEYTIGTYTPYGYYTGFIFPRNFDLYSKYLTFDGMPKHRKKWKKAFIYMVKMLTVGHKGKQLFLKNPSLSYRIPDILEMYPNAKFIHTYRNPYKVYSSSVKFFDEVFAIYTLQTWDKDKMKQDILDNYKLLYEKFDEALALIPKENIVHSKYEDFITDPVNSLKAIYDQLRIDGWEEHKQDIVTYAESQIKDYKPNVHTTDDDVIKRVNKHWNKMLQDYGYEKLEPKS